MGKFDGFTCDKCKKEFRSDEKPYQPVAIELRVNFGYISTLGGRVSNLNGEVVWCRDCLMSTGFHRPITDDDKKIAPENQMSFEDRFAELIQEMGFVLGDQ